MLYIRTFRAQTFKPDLLAIDNKSFFQTFDVWRGYIVKAKERLAIIAFEVRVALNLAAIVREFKIPRAVVSVGLVQDSRATKIFEGSINSRFVGGVFTETGCDLLF